MAEVNHDPAGNADRSRMSVQSGRRLAAAAVVLLLAIAVLSVAGNALRRATYQAVDPFSSLQITAHGESPDIWLDVVWPQDTPFLQAAVFSVPEDLTQLKNGDTVTFRVSVDRSVCDEYRMKLTGTEYTYRVDVPDYEEVDPFAFLEIKTEGASPFISLTYAQMSDDPFLADVRISADYNYDLASGDTVTFTAEADPAACDEYRKKLSRDSMTCTVSADEYYITPGAQLSDSARAALADSAARSLAALLDTGSGAAYQVNEVLTERYAGGAFTRNWTVEQYTAEPLCVFVTEPAFSYKSHIFIALNVSGVYRAPDNIETDPASPIADTSVWVIEYRDVKADQTGILSFSDRGASHIMYESLDDVRFEIRRDHGAITEIDLSDMAK